MSSFWGIVFYIRKYKEYNLAGFNHQKGKLLNCSGVFLRTLMDGTWDWTHEPRALAMNPVVSTDLRGTNIRSLRHGG